MTPAPQGPYTTSQELPPYRAIVAVDARGFTDQPGRLHQSISGLIPQLVEQAFTAAGLLDVWNKPEFFGPTGDGFAVGLPTRCLPFVLHPFLAELQRVLAGHNGAVTASGARLQLRVSVNVGPVEDGPDACLGGGGAARNDTHRLLDSVPVRAVLAGSDPNVTFVSAIVSDRVYQDVLLTGYAGLHPSEFIEVPATVEGKNFAQRAWLYVPRPSGGLAQLHLPSPPGGKPAGDGPPRSPAESETVIHAPGNQGGVAGTVHGGMTWNTGRPQ
ncbi:hypothetical protein [Actinoplanes sp. N902-109]|uniref:hypothetical protein n=1 Tax=Actinoplanes sp. (strain N902-109) TaxID=649831 RepID=UPI00032945F0|nr:hypothetical protein [Actinoplanes sp. N902-109]AGL18941.1 hypothetical protein L083_5431 [Actinoplanes sp. N902-109]